MKRCCPPGEGCNRPPGYEERCWLLRLERLDGEEASRAVELWRHYRRRARSAQPRERRALRRAYARVRDRTLEPLVTHQRLTRELRGF